MNRLSVLLASLGTLLSACGGSFPPPTQRMADAQSAERSARELGADAELAEVVANTRQSEQSSAGLVTAMHADEKKAVAATAAELERTKAQLAKFATVKQEPRGKVITLSGGVLFASAKWDLLPAAQLKLNDVATALTEEAPTSKMVVEGHTDSQGAASYNQDLSQHRAQAVRDYLVTRGIASDRSSAQGFGPTRAIGDNGSP